MKRLSNILLMMLTAVLLTSLTSCSSSSEDSPEPDLKPGDTVNEFKKVVQYGNSKQFQTDLDALVTYALDIRAVRWAYFNMASKG